MPLGQRVVAAAVGRDRLGRERQRRGELGRRDRPAADQRYWTAGVVEDAACQSRITTAEMLFLGEPSITRSE